MKRKKASKRPAARPFQAKVRRIPSSSDAARDEGPRLIPLDDHSKDASRLEHYLDLADTALGLKREHKTK